MTQEKKINDWDKGFVQGFVAAMRVVYEFEGRQPATVVMEMYKCNRVKEKDFDKFDIDESDREMLIHLNKSI